MKKLVALLAVFISSMMTAQNFQLHYDLEREHFTTTFEMFKMDKYGNTFTFVDFDYDQGNISQGYYEIARVIKLPKWPIGAHIEYNGGLGKNFGGYSINNAWIFGANYSKGNAQRGFSTYLGYKSIKGADKANVQLTGTWYINFLKNKMTFSGFADLWSENFKGAENKNIFLAEPQLWYHLNKNLSLGGELEISNNFAGETTTKLRPTLGAKWNF